MLACKIMLQQIPNYHKMARIFPKTPVAPIQQPG